MNNLLKEILNHFHEELQKGLTFEEVTHELIKNSEESLGNAFDLSELIDVQYFINLSKAQYPKTDEEKKTAFENTLKLYELEDSFLRCEFLELSKFDKIIYQNKEPILVKLNTFFNVVEEHMFMILAFDNILNNPKLEELSLVTSKSEKNDELINPKINTLQRAYTLTKSEDVKDSLKVYNEFKKNPLEIDIILATLSNLSYNGKVRNPDIININVLHQSRQFLECNDINFDRDKIMESLAVYFFSIYHKDSYLNKLLHIPKELSRSKVAQIANVILESTFENESFNYKHTHVIKPTQFYTHFLSFLTPLLEFRNSINYQEHPFLEKDVELDVLSFFKSK